MKRELARRQREKKNIYILKRKQSEEEEKRRGLRVSNSAHLLSGGQLGGENTEKW